MKSLIECSRHAAGLRTWRARIAGLIEGSGLAGVDPGKGEFSPR